MPIFSYYAKSLKGKVEKGILEAKDEKELFTILRKKGYILVSSKEEGEKKKVSPLSLIFRKVPLKEKLFFTKNLQVMIETGVSLPRALGILYLQTRNKRFKEVISEIRERIIKGESFSSCLSSYPDIFPELFFNMVKVGEETGKLADVLSSLSLYMERDYELRTKVKGAMLYPAVVLSAMVGIGILMLVFVVPKLSETFKELNVPIPFTTRIVFSLGNLFLKYWFIILFLFLLLIIFFFFRRKRKSKLFDKILLKTPIISNIIKKLNTAYTARTLSSLGAAGVPVVTSLKITAHVVDNLYFKEIIENAAKDVEKGEKISKAFSHFNKKMKVYPPLFIQMLQVGEETGETSKVLKKLAEFFEGEVENTSENLSSIIEPILILLLGGAIGLFAVSIFQPIYSMVGNL